MVAPLLRNTSHLKMLVDLNIKRTRNAAQLAVQFAEFHNLTYYEPVAGIYIWLRLSQDCHTANEEEAIVQRCAKQGAFVGSGSDYSEAQAGWFRLTIALPDDIFLEALRRIETALEYNKSFQPQLEGTDEKLGFSLVWRWLGLM